MRVLLILLGAGTIFLSGLITGYDYAHQQWQETWAFSESEPELQETVESKPSPEKDDLSSDLLERQKQLKNKGTENLFSSIGESLDLFKKAE